MSVSRLLLILKEVLENGDTTLETAEVGVLVRWGPVVVVHSWKDCMLETFDLTKRIK